MHSSTLLTSFLAVGSLALPQAQLEKRQQATVTVTVTIFVNPYATPAWTPPHFPQTPISRPGNAPPAWTPPHIGNPNPANTPRPSTPGGGIIRPSTPVVPPVIPSTPVVPPVAPSSPPVNVPGGTPTPAPTPAPSGAPLDPGHIAGVAQASLSVGLAYQNAILFHHNIARANHGALPLVWDDTVAQTAALAANTCRFEHFIPTGLNQGQNLFTVSGNFFNVTAGITESWYKGEFQAMLPYFGAADVPSNVFHSVGHLTQVLWKGATRVGCVSVDCGDRMIVGGAPSRLNKYTVCNYAPAGNVAGQYGANVGRPISTVNLGSWID